MVGFGPQQIRKFQQKINAGFAIGPELEGKYQIDLGGLSKDKTN